jgi:two-component system, NarL family, response regulator DesR
VGDIRVLVVDDDRDVRSVLRTHFDLEAGYVVVDEATDGREAIALAALVQPDLIVLDSMMPGLDGVDALPELAAAAPDALIVLFSAVVEAPAIGRFGRQGVAAVVPKADGVDSLQRVLDELVAARRT